RYPKPPCFDHRGRVLTTQAQSCRGPHPASAPDVDHRSVAMQLREVEFHLVHRRHLGHANLVAAADFIDPAVLPQPRPIPRLESRREATPKTPHATSAKNVLIEPQE